MITEIDKREGILSMTSALQIAGNSNKKGRINLMAPNV